MIAGAGSRGWLHCRLGDFEIRFDWDVEPGHILVLFGASGSGKTTALRGIAGLLRPVAGRVEIGSELLYDSESRVWVPTHRRRVGYLTQQYHLFPHLNLARNIAYGLETGQGKDSRLQTEELLSAFQLQGLEERYPWELSGGQRQRAALARAIAAGPRLLLLDEPFSALDAGLRRVLRRELRATLHRNPVPVILVTHDREEALSLGDEVQVIENGRAIARGVPVEVLGQPGQATVARLVGVENLFRMKVMSRQPRDGTMLLAGEDTDTGFTLEAPLGWRPNFAGRTHFAGRVGECHGGHPRVRHHTSVPRAGGVISPQPDSRRRGPGGAKAAGIHRRAGLRRSPAVSSYRGLAGGNGHPAGATAVGRLQSLLVLSGGRRAG